MTHPGPDQLSHVPVLLDEVLALLAPEAGERLVDATAGLGGHARAIARVLGPGGHVLLNDLDSANLARAQAALVDAAMPADRVVSIHGAFDDLPKALHGQPPADLLLADMGFASTQVDDPERGLSFRSDGPLDMRFDPSGAAPSAADLVAELDRDELADLIRRYGEERFAGRIAAKVVAEREVRPILTTTHLAGVISSAVPRTRDTDRIHPATRTFQALRIVVNDELGRLERLLRAIGSAARQVSSGQPTWLAPGARVGVISFHSLEDRPVKSAFQEWVSEGTAEALTRKPIRATEAESGRNPRARSAKLRGVRLIGPGLTSAKA